MITTTPKPPMTELKALPNGRTAWRCSSCGTHNDGGQLSCLACDTLRSDLCDEAHMLVQALEPDKQTTEVWRDLAGVLTADSKLEVAIHEALIRQAGQSVSTDRGPVCWVTGPEHEAVAGSMGFWFNRQVPPESGNDPPPDLIGEDLLGAVRDLYGIPRPGPHKYPQPWTPGAGKPEAVRNRKSAWSPEELDLLGKQPDADVAKETGRSRRAVQTKRNKLGIPEFNGSPPSKQERSKPVAKKKSTKNKATRKPSKATKRTRSTKAAGKGAKASRPTNDQARKVHETAHSFPRLIARWLIDVEELAEFGSLADENRDRLLDERVPCRLVEVEPFRYVFEAALERDTLGQSIFRPAILRPQFFDLISFSVDAW